MFQIMIEVRCGADSMQAGRGSIIVFTWYGSSPLIHLNMSLVALLHDHLYFLYGLGTQQQWVIPTG